MIRTVLAALARVAGRSTSAIPLAAFVLLAVAILGTQATSAQSVDPVAWQLIDDGDPFSGGFHLYFDSVAQRVVLMEDLGSGDENPSLARPPVHWHLVGDDWKRQTVAEPSAKTVRGCGAYDSSRHVYVVFGSLFNDETWEFDGTVWIQKNPATRPPARALCAMAYDATRARTVLFGGMDIDGAPKSDTWEFDGTNWQQRAPPAFPNARSEHAMAFDSGHSVVVLMGGRTGVNSVFYNDLWEYDGTRWRQKSPPTIPEARGRASMAYDPNRQKTVVFGGYNNLHELGDTWEWNGVKWTQIATAQAPSARDSFAVTFDPTRAAIVGFGGRTESTLANDTWTYDGATWTPIAASASPRQRQAHGMAYDPQQDRVVMHAGFDGTQTPATYLQDTWLFDGARWIDGSAAGTTSAQVLLPLTYDSQGQRIVAFSGSNPSGLYNQDVHSYSGAPRAWSSTPSCCPAPDGRNSGAVADAPELGGVAMFGGFACCFFGSNYDANDTWLLNGSSWTEQQPMHRPPGRDSHGLTYDSTRRRLVAYGGSLNATAFGVADTWVYDGTDWTQLFASSPPGARVALSLTYDAARDRVVLFGGGPALEGVTWEFDGGSWVSRPTPRLPDPDRTEFQLAYDSKRRVVWLFGGNILGSTLYFNDTWAYGPDPDGDGIVGGLDNCPNAANVNQANDDADVAGNVCDCAPGDPGTWSAPQLVGGLLVSGIGTTTLTWADQSATVGPGVRYDVGTGDLIALQSTGSYGGATCLVNQTAVPSANDARTPGPASGFWYLVRARNVCGLGTYGAPALDVASPCP